MNSGSARTRTPGWPDDRGRRPVRPEEIVSLRIKEMVCAALLLASSSACSYQPTGGATIPSPLVAQIGGTWTGPVTLVGATDVSAPLAGTLACVGNALKQQTSSDTATLILTQSGVDLAGRLTMEHSGLACNYTGTASPGAFVLSTPNLEEAKANTCDAPTIVVRCASGAVFDVIPIGATITASVANGVATGTLAQTYNAEVRDDTAPPTESHGVTTSSSLALAVRR
jgi:hypothetical protein